MFRRIINMIIPAAALLFLLSSCLSIPSDLNLASCTQSPSYDGANASAPPPTSSPPPVKAASTMAIYRLGKVTLSDEESRLYVREGPGENYRAVGALQSGVVVKVFSENTKDWDQIEFNGGLFYAASNYIVKNKSLTETERETYYYTTAQQERTEICTLPPSIIASSNASPGQELDINGDGVADGIAVDNDGDMVVESLQYRVVDHLVDLKYHLPSLEYNLLLSGTDNPAGRPLSNLPSVFLQYDAMVWLRKAQAIFIEDGYTIMLYDAYRPHSAHMLLCQTVGAPYFDAREVSPHCRGASVDIALIDLASGSPLNMPCNIYEFCEASHRNYAGMSETQRHNIYYMESVMERCGFISNSDFWWQYDFSLYRNYMATDYSAEDILLVRES